MSLASDPSRLTQAAVDEVVKRISNTGIEYELAEHDDIEGYFLALEIPIPGGSHGVNLFCDDDVIKFLNLDLSQCKYLPKPTAVFMSSVQTIFSPITFVDTFLLDSQRRRSMKRIIEGLFANASNSFDSIGNIYGIKNNVKTYCYFENKYDGKDIDISITENAPNILFDSSPLIFLAIRCDVPWDAQYYLNMLTTVANSLFFKIHTLSGLTLTLQDPPGKDRYAYRIVCRTCDTITELSEIYDPQPYEIFKYAQSASQMPLVQFLALYQVIEFYFMKYMDKSLKESISMLLRDADFNKKGTDHISRIINVVRNHSHGGSRYGEKELLAETIKRCINDSDMINFLNNNSYLKSFLSDKNKARFLSSYYLARKQDGSFASDIVTVISHRIYEIRCRIVHAKDTPDSNTKSKSPILPYSEEATMLKYDIGLIAFIARQVLMANSASMA